MVSEPLNTELISSIQQFCLNKVFDKLGNPGQRYDEYKPSWRRFSKDANGQERQGERMSSFTLEEIQKAVTVEFGQKNVDTERSVGSQSDLAFDLYNPSERTAFEICLGAIKNEFEKDILKARLDSETVTLVILYREYKSGPQGRIYGRRWFDEPAQKQKIELVGRYKTKVLHHPLVIETT